MSIDITTSPPESSKGGKEDLAALANSLGIKTPEVKQTTPTTDVEADVAEASTSDSDDIPSYDDVQDNESASDTVDADSGEPDEDEVDIPTAGEADEFDLGISDTNSSNKRLFTTHTPVFKPIKPGTKVSNLSPLSIPTISNFDALKVINKLSNNAAKLSREQLVALNVIIEGSNLYPEGGVVENFLENAKDLTNHVQMPNGKILTQNIPAQRDPTPGSVVSGSEALSLLARKRKSLDTVNVPAPHSGIWLKISSPQLTDIHRLQGRLTAIRETLGYETAGTTLTCDSALRNLVFMNWVLELTEGTNMKDSSEENIRKNLTSLDIPLIAANLASILYPSGHMVERSCSTKVVTCSHVERDILRISKSIHIDTSRLTEQQLAHMQTIMHSGHLKSEEQMQAYRDGFSKTLLREVSVEDGVKVTFKAPSLDSYAEATNEWVARIRGMSEDLIANMTTDEANRHLINTAKLELLTKYCPWVESIDIDGRVVNERADIQLVLARLSEEEETVDRFSKAITQYMSDCTVGAFGVYDYKCPKCKGTQQPEGNGSLAAIIPIDPVTTFFTLAQLKTTQYLQNVSDY